MTGSVPGRVGFFQKDKHDWQTNLKKETEGLVRKEIKRIHIGKERERKKRRKSHYLCLYRI
jgi:hypothetical protein